MDRRSFLKSTLAIAVVAAFPVSASKAPALRHVGSETSRWALGVDYANLDRRLIVPWEFSEGSSPIRASECLNNAKISINTNNSVRHVWRQFCVP